MITITAAGPNACILKETTVSSSVEFAVPASVADVKAGLKALLNAPDDPSKQCEHAGLLFVRMRESIRIVVGAATFEGKWFDLMPIVLAE